jgi:3-oxoacyl-[acyl-carrier-protein] synthase II
MVNRRVVITGLGATCPTGSTVDAAWQAVRTSVPAQDLTGASELHPTARVADIDFTGLAVNRKEVARMNRADQLAVVAAATAVLHAGWSTSDGGEHKGLFLGTAKDFEANPNLLQLVKPLAALGFAAGAAAMVDNATRYLTPFALLDCMPNLAMHYISSTFNLRGDNCCFLHTGAAGTAAVAAAYRAIAAGRISAALAGGFDSLIDRLALARFDSLGLLSEDRGRAWCRPFDRRRDGFHPGESGAMLVLEDRDVALARGARIRGEILGVGSACEPRIAPEACTGTAVAQALTAAIASAGLLIDGIGFIIASGEGTVHGDRGEALGIGSALRGAHVPVTALKGIFGHLVAASGPLDMMMALRALDESEIPQAFGCGELDAPCAISLVRGQVLHAQAQAAAVISTGFGGQACAVVLGRGH